MESHVEGLFKGACFRELLDARTTFVKEKYHLKKAEIDVLFYLYNDNVYNTARDIQKALYMNKGYISQILDNLNKAGYIDVIPDKEDRRFVHYVVTDQAKPVAEDIQGVFREIGERLFRDVSEEERETFKQISKIIGKNMQEMLTE